MSDLLAITRLLKATISVPVYSGEIPETQTDPAVAYNNIANPFAGRSLSGRKYGRSSVWRATIVAERAADVESVIQEFEDLDNTSNADFQRVHTNLVNTDNGTDEQPYRRAFVDITVYKR